MGLNSGAYMSENVRGAILSASELPVIELTKLGNQIYAKTYHPFEIYISLGVLYFVMTYSMTFVARKLERKATKWQ